MIKKTVAVSLFILMIILFAYQLRKPLLTEAIAESKPIVDLHTIQPEHIIINGFSEDSIVAGLTDSQIPTAIQVEPNAYGFDIWEMQAIPPVSREGQTYDYMSYNFNDPFWVSIYTWKAIASLLGQPGLDV